ncbi:unnamed protein product [Triticum turgidum subsp. durum]|uniref:Peptidase A1 domain-containing protein n=1 Tax=Triticum turgidum subsp. durum TaxID=4567 RepID=A0A9R0ZKG8_TRITD|nr:unnamed protein product [Triticum turgidum subsp. durum]
MPQSLTLRLDVSIEGLELDLAFQIFISPVWMDTGLAARNGNKISGIDLHVKAPPTIELTLYDPSGSSSGTGVTCGQEFCVATHGGVLPSCVPAAPCQYSISYGDGSSTTGFFVTDFLQYNQVSGNSQTTPANTSITFGCGAKIGGDLGSSSQALDGILGFGQSNSSMLSQLAAAGKVRKVFAHCLDTINGGGIFAIGDVVQPKMIYETIELRGQILESMVFRFNKNKIMRPHYNVNLEAIDVGGVKLQLPTNIFGIEESKGTIIDSGTTLAYLPGVVYNAIMSKVFAQYGEMPLKNDQDFQCFRYSGSVDDGFPIITFHFEGGLPLNIHPHDYLFQNGKYVQLVLTVGFVLLTLSQTLRKQELRALGCPFLCGICSPKMKWHKADLLF